MKPLRIARISTLSLIVVMAVAATACSGTDNRSTEPPAATERTNTTTPSGQTDAGAVEAEQQGAPTEPAKPDVATPAPPVMSTPESPATDATRHLTFTIIRDNQGDVIDVTYEAVDGPPTTAADNGTQLVVKLRDPDGAMVVGATSSSDHVETPLPMVGLHAELTVDGVVVADQLLQTIAPAGDVVTHVRLTVSRHDPTIAEKLSLIPRIAGPLVRSMALVTNEPVEPTPLPPMMDPTPEELGADEPSSGADMTFLIADSNGDVLATAVAPVQCDLRVQDVVYGGCIASVSFVPAAMAGMIIVQLDDREIVRADPGQQPPELVSVTPTATDVLDADQKMVYEWAAQNDGAAPVLFRMQERDGNGGWRTTGLDWNEKTAYRPTSGSYANVQNGAYRLMLTDGLHITLVELPLPRWRPTVWIYRTAELLPLLEQGRIHGTNVPDAQLVEWSTSDRGVVSLEPLLDMALLGAGEHQLTLRVVAADGLDNSHTIDIELCDADGLLVPC